MHQRSSTRPSVVSITAAASVLTAWLAADYFRLGIVESDRWIRLALLAAAALAGTSIGAATECLRLAAPGRLPLIAPLLLTPFVGGLLPLLPGLEWEGRTLKSAVTTCFALGAAIAPLLAFLSWLTVRFCPVEADRRLPWLVLFAAGFAVTPHVLGGAPQFEGRSWSGVELTVLIAASLVVACARIVAADVAATLGFWRARRARAPRAGTRLPASPYREMPVLDVPVARHGRRLAIATARGIGFFAASVGYGAFQLSRRPPEWYRVLIGD
jgi:hypothetical protein